MNDHSTLPLPEFPGLVGDHLPPGATRTGFIPAAADLDPGDRFAFVLTGDPEGDVYTKIGDVLPGMEGTRIAVSAPAWFFEAHANRNVHAFYAIQRVDGVEAFSGTRSFYLGTSDGKPIGPREWYVADFEEFADDVKIPARMAFMTSDVSPVGTTLTLSKDEMLPYIVKNSLKTPSDRNGFLILTFDFPIKRVRCGFRTYNNTANVNALDAQGNSLGGQTFSDSRWFDQSDDGGKIAKLRIYGNGAIIDNLSIVPAEPDETDATRLDEAFDSLPVDNGTQDTRLLPAWRVAAASGLIAIEDAVTGLSGHVLAIHQSLDDICTHYFTPRLTVSPGRVAIRLRTLSTLSATARVVAAYQVRSLLDATRHEIREVTIDGNSQIVELGGADPDEHLSYIAVTQTGGGATTLYYDDIKAT